MAAPEAAKAGGIFGGLKTQDMMLPLMAMSMMGQGGGPDDKGGGYNPNAGKKYVGGGRDDVRFPGSDYKPGIDPEFSYFPGTNYVERFSSGGLVKGFAEGGLASLGNQEGPSQDTQLVQMTIAALKGQVPNAKAIIQMFVKAFGEEALADLMNRIQGGDGQSDSVPAQINAPNGSAPAALSEGEYVVPSDVVSSLGNGSTNAGAKQLDDMMSRVRAERTGSPSAPQPVQPFQLMPS